MLEIKLKDVDELHNLSTELSVLTYLQHLYLCDFGGQIICDKEFESARKSAVYYLMDKQLETLAKLQRLLHREDFPGNSLRKIYISD